MLGSLMERNQPERKAATIVLDFFGGLQNAGLRLVTRSIQNAIHLLCLWLYATDLRVVFVPAKRNESNLYVHTLFS